jgi:hypothetical protein
MLDKEFLKTADTSVLIEAASECCRQQQKLLTSIEEEEDGWIDDFQRLEEVRSYILHLIDWQNQASQLQHRKALQLLQRLDQENRERLESVRDELAARLRQLRMKREMSSEYLSFQGTPRR